MTCMAFVYQAPFVPSLITLKELLQYFHGAEVAPQVQAAQALVAKRTRVWKIDGARKPARRVNDDGEGPAKTVVLTVVNEEDFLVFPQRRARGEGKHAFHVLVPELRSRREANSCAADAGLLVGIVSDDYEHCRYDQAMMVMEVYDDKLPYSEMGKVRQRVEALEAAALRGELGFLSAQDTKHKSFELTHDIPKSSTSAPLYQDCFDAGQARFSAPSMPAALATAAQAGAPLPPAPARARIVRLLREATRVSASEFKTARAKASNQAAVRDTRKFLARADVCESPVWLEAVQHLPPWGELSRLAALLNVPLHAASSPWKLPDHRTYMEKTQRRLDWFANVVPGKKRRLGILRPVADVQCADDENCGEGCVVTPAVRDHARRCQREIYWRGCENWAVMCHWLRSAGVEPASGTTDVEVANAEIIDALRAGRISSIGELSFDMHADVVFLAVVHRRSHAGMTTQAAHSKRGFARAFGMMEALIECLAGDEAALAAQWQAKLDQQRAADARPMKRRRRVQALANGAAPKKRGRKAGRWRRAGP